MWHHRTKRMLRASAAGRIAIESAHSGLSLSGFGWRMSTALIGIRAKYFGQSFGQARITKNFAQQQQGLARVIVLGDGLEGPMQIFIRSELFGPSVEPRVDLG